MVNMKIDHFVVGPVQTNCYFVTNIKTKEMIIIDPGACANQLAKKVDESGAKPVAILLTHGHFDHATDAKPLALKGAGKLTRAIIGSLRFTRIDVVLGVRGEDPAEAARSYGRLNAWLYPTLGFLDRFVYLDFEQLRLLPDFGSAEPTIKDHVSFRVTARAYAIVFTLLRVLYAFWREKVLDVFL